MANPSLFRSKSSALTRNEAGGPAFALSSKQALAQYAATGCLSRTFYATDAEQLDKVLTLCTDVDARFIAKVAIYAREQGFMKDMPALLCAVLAVRGPELLPPVFRRVIDNGRMLRTFVQIVRSGAVGRRSLGTMPRRLVREWLAGKSEDALLRASVGRSPSLGDIVKMVHPKPDSPSRSAIYAHLCGRPYPKGHRTELLRRFESFKSDVQAEVPDVPFQMLTALRLSTRHWRAIACQAPWQTTRMNLNTFLRHGVFDDSEIVAMVADRLRDREAIARSRVFPYQLMAAYMNTTNEMPLPIRSALQDAMEIATANVPAIPGKVYVCVDVSGSMHGSVTGYRKGATSRVRCIDVAALFAAAILRANPSAEVIPFAEKVRKVRLNPRDTVCTNAEKLTGLPWGGTDCSSAVRHLVEQRRNGDLIVFLSDNESWMGPQCRGTTATLRAYEQFKKRNPRARMVCLDMQPYASVQAPPRGDILHVGGFSDQVFRVVRSFAAVGSDPDHWVRIIERTAP